MESESDLSLNLKAPDILREAERLVTGPRAEAYGSAHASFTQVAEAWSAVFGWEVRPEQVPMAMAILKMVRAQVSPDRRDHYYDGSAYLALAGEVANAALKPLPMESPTERVSVAPRPLPERSRGTL